MAYSANGYNFPSKSLSRVKYDLEYDSDNDLYRFKGKPSKVIVAAHNAAPGVFFDSSDDYSQVWFNASAIDGNYGDQVFFDIINNKNLIVLSAAITEPCLSIVNGFINYSIIEFSQGDIPPAGYLITGEEIILD